MKCKVILGKGSVVFSAALIAGIAALAYILYVRGETVAAACALAALLFLVGASLFCAPTRIGLGDDALVVYTPLRRVRLPFESIESVRICPPTMAARRIWGSGGFLGYWGLFSERDLGRYTAFHGRASDCFLVTLRDGRKYMLGCEDYPAMVSSIKEALSAASPA